VLIEGREGGGDVCATALLPVGEGGEGLEQRGWLSLIEGREALWDSDVASPGAALSVERGEGDEDGVLLVAASPLVEGREARREVTAPLAIERGEGGGDVLRPLGAVEGGERLRHITALAVEAGEALGDVVGPLAEERREGVEARVALVEGAESAGHVSVGPLPVEGGEGGGDVAAALRAVERREGTQDVVRVRSAPFGPRHALILQHPLNIFAVAAVHIMRSPAVERCDP